MATNTTRMSEDGDIYAQRFYPRVTDQGLIAEAMEACADTHFLVNAVKEAGGLKGELFLNWCKDRLEPGKAWSNMTVAPWTPPVRKPVSGLVALIIAGVATVYVYLVYTGKIPRWCYDPRHKIADRGSLEAMVESMD